MESVDSLKNVKRSLSRSLQSSLKSSLKTAAFLHQPSLIATLAACLLLPPGAQAQLLIEGNDEYENLIFDVTALDAAVPSASSPSVVDAATATDVAATDITPSATDLPDTTDAGSSVAGSQTLANLQAGIDSALANDGLYSEALRQQYQQLAALQQRLGQHESAITTLEKSVHIARVNDGLFTLDQEADVQRIIESLVAMGDSEREADYRSYLYYMQQRAYEPGDPRLVAARLAWADWNLANYQRESVLHPRRVQLRGSSRPEELMVVHNTRTGDVRFVPRRFLGSAATLPNALNETSRYALTPEMAIDTRLETARDIYEELLADPALDPAQREELQLKLVAGEYALKRHIDRLLGEDDIGSPFRITPGLNPAEPMMLRRGYRESRNRLEQEVAALEGDPVTDPVALAAAYVRVADLIVAYGFAREADPYYGKAWHSLLRGGLSEADAGAWLHPALLHPVPDFAVHPHSRALFGLTVDDTLTHRGYIDVSLNLTRNGDVRRAEIIEASADTPQRVRRRLLDYLRNQKMRPPLEAGVPVEQEGLQLRFNYGY